MAFQVRHHLINRVLNHFTWLFTGQRIFPFLRIIRRIVYRPALMVCSQQSGNATYIQTVPGEAADGEGMGFLQSGVPSWHFTDKATAVAHTDFTLALCTDSTWGTSARVGFSWVELDRVLHVLWCNGMHQVGKRHFNCTVYPPHLKYPGLM